MVYLIFLELCDFIKHRLIRLSVWIIGFTLIFIEFVLVAQLSQHWSYFFHVSVDVGR